MGYNDEGDGSNRNGEVRREKLLTQNLQIYLSQVQSDRECQQKNQQGQSNADYGILEKFHLLPIVGVKVKTIKTKIVCHMY